MFTGLVAERGRLGAPPSPSGQGGVRLEILHSEALGERLELGASLAVNGVCLTVTAREPGKSAVELSPETLSRTTLGSLEAGSPVNLEPALRMGDPLGGHWVQGHVDTTVRVLDRRDLEEHCEMAFELPAEVAPFLVEKGSVTLDGVSLTVSSLSEPFSGAHSEASFEVALIPHTLEVTTLGATRPGDRLNLEIDVLAKYVERILVARGLSGR